MDVTHIIANKKMVRMKLNSDGDYEFDTTTKIKDEKTQMIEDA